jgi:DNA-binding phage protein
VAESPPGKWADIRGRYLSTPESEARYERKKRAIVLTRQVLLKIDDERRLAGMSKAELARRVGATPSVIRRVFSSQSSNPTLTTVLDMLDALGIDFELTPSREGREPPAPASRSASPRTRDSVTP